MRAPESSYYPPRRNAWRRWVGNPIRAAWREWWRRGVPVHSDWSFGSSLGALLLPGYALVGLRRPWLQRFWWLAYGTCWAAALIGLGFLVGDLAVGLLVALHASALVGWLGRHGVNLRDGHGVMVVAAALTMVTLTVYLPLGGEVIRRMWLPLASPEGVIVINCTASPKGLGRGDFVAYTGANPGTYAYQGGVYVADGPGCGRVLAVAGDHVEFSSEFVWINGEPQPRLPDMPTEGHLRIPAGSWFVWPRLVQTNGRANADIIAAALLRVAVVHESRFLGRPFVRWFGRRQPLS
ncbi:MAG: hypothetical protein JNN07_06135 [Verrucomicrobiales bacterium]|nr:hypothetical protein [Verrucomicrobiales bacterium]